MNDPNTTITDSFSKDEQRLNEMMMDLWGSFAVAGRPTPLASAHTMGADAQPFPFVWHPFDARNLTGGDWTLMLDYPRPQVVQGHKAEDCYFWGRL